MRKISNRRKPMEVSIRDIAEATGLHYRTVLRHEKSGRFRYGDIGSVSMYIDEVLYDKNDTD